MGEVVMSSEEGGGTMEMRVAAESPVLNKKEGGCSATAEATMSNVVRWEKFLPRMVLRVLLVEADDSTRQIIAALLRKCSYKVAAVSDGLKAWEVLKGRPHNIDLILTEVELPSISGFALLSLIMEHETCKSIPVIMMSAHDSVSTVYKCMLRGAADFLVKPVRKNELKNLWQHVWRRQAPTSCGGNGPQEESDMQQKVEATAENNATSNHSSGYMACIQLNKECIEKGSDAQSSCTKPDMEAEGPHMEQVKDLSQSGHAKSLSSDMKWQKYGEYDKTTKQLLRQETEIDATASRNTNKITQENNMAGDNQSQYVNGGDGGDNHVNFSSSREAIDLIGSFDSFPKSSPNCCTNKVNPSPMLDLSLRRCNPSASVNDERHRLKQSDVSAFSRYINRTQHPLVSGSTCISNQQKDNESNADKPFSKQTIEYNSDTLSAAVASPQQHAVSWASSQQGQAGSQFPSPKQNAFPVPVPVRSLRFETPCTPYGSVLPPIFCLQQGLMTMHSPGSSGHQEPSCQTNPYYMSNPEARSSQELHHLMDRMANNANDQTENKQGNKLESLEDRGHFSSATDQSTSSGFCNGTLNRLNSTGSGSNGNMVRAAAESGNESGLHRDGSSHRSLQREAALTKFRMKRKDRCYEKKVRYESRKKLAEQRPRVKGQFVRQVQTSEPTPMETDGGKTFPG